MFLFGGVFVRLLGGVFGCGGSLARGLLTYWLEEMHWGKLLAGSTHHQLMDNYYRQLLCVEFHPQIIITNMVIIVTILSVNHHHHHHHLQQRNTEQNRAKHIVLVGIVFAGTEVFTWSHPPSLCVCSLLFALGLLVFYDIPDLLNKLVCHFLFLLLHTFQLSVQTPKDSSPNLWLSY